jgi:uncharacterized repeat protein (TIGR01451 family)
MSSILRFLKPAPKEAPPLPRYWSAALLGLLLACGPAGWAQRGKTGAGTVTAAGTIVNTYTSLSADAAAGASTITVANSALTGGAFGTTALAAGDFVMLIQMQGATINTTATANTYGDVTLYNNAGRYELLEVKAVPNATSITFQCALANSYTATGHVQVVRIPRYTTLTLNASTSIVAPAWNGTTGGIVALDVQGNITLNANARIDVSGLGFRGGAVTNDAQASTAIVTLYASATVADGGIKGESIAGSATDYDGLTGRYGRGAPANGGGGGNSHNAAGGGGANVGTGTWLGSGNPNRGTGNAYDNAWNLEPAPAGFASFAASTSPGGGRGGYTFSSTNQDALTVGPGNTAWGGNNRQNVGGLGGRPLDVTNRIFFGGGGGSGNANNSGGQAGGNGGGLIYIFSGGNIATGGASGAALLANGANVPASGPIDAPGGGGGGGTIVLNTSGSLSSVAVNAQGGAGGNHSSTNDEGEGPGGGGGGGYIVYSSTAAPAATFSVAAGANGNTTSTSLTEFLPNGATAGGAGVVTTAAYNAQCQIVADVATTLTTSQSAVLAGAAITYTATVRNVGTTTATDVVPQVQLPGGLLNVVVKDKNGATVTNSATSGYNVATGLVVFPAETTLASGASFSYTITFPAPNYTVTITGKGQNTASSTDPAPADNNGTATNANVQTVVSLPGNSCAGTPYSSAGSGLYAEFYATYFNDNLGFFAANTPSLTRTDALLNYATDDSWGNIVPPAANTLTNPDLFSTRHRGSIKITTAGTYTLRLTSDDASYLWLDGAALAATPTLASATISSPNLHSATPVTSTVRLSAGTHNLLVFYGENQGGNTLTLQYSGPDTGNSSVIIPNAVLCPTLVNIPPVATAVTNSPAIANTGGVAPLSPLAGTDQDGTVDNYYIAALPTAAQGVLSLNGAPVSAGQTIPAAQAGALQFTPATTFAGNATFTFQAVDNTGQLSNNLATYTIPVVFGISGTVFEDINYGGGLGRSLATASGVAVGTAATVELYDGSGNFVATTQTSTAAGTLGRYTFAVATAGTYTVRVVNSTVRSTRPGSVAGLLPVQTYNGSTDRVGGEDPLRGDAPANSGTQTLAALSVATAGTTTGTIAESQQAITLSGTTGSTGRDFGFSFDVVTNANDAGQGSLRQFLTNANTLTNAGLAQVGQPAGKEVSIFMIPNGATTGVPAGLRSGLTSGLTNGVAVITPATLLPAIADAGTSVDGTTQTTNIGNSNAGVLGAGGNVGTGPNGVDETSGTTDDLVLSQTNRPEVQIQNGAGLAIGLDVRVAGTTLRGLSVVGFGNVGNDDNNANVRVSNVGNFLIEGNFLGLAATKPDFSTSGTASSGGDDLRILGGTGNGTATGATASIVQNNLIGYSNGKGIGVEGGSTGIVIRNNEIRNNGIGTTNLDGIDIETSSNIVVTGNLIVDNAADGVDSYNSVGGNVITGNTITGNGRANGETPGVRVYGAGTTVSQNIIRDNYGAGIMVQATGTNNTFSLNSISGNGNLTTLTGGAASGQLGIDLLAGSDNDGRGTAPYVTRNDNGDGDTGGNGLINFPVIQTATLSGTSLKLTGFAKAGAAIEFYVAAPDGSGFGEGSLYLTTQTEGVNDADGLTGSYSGLVNGLDQGAETSQNRFSFTIPLSSLSAQQLAALQLGAQLTSTATLSGQGTSEFSGNISLSADVTTTITGPATLAAGQVTGTFTAAFSNAGNAPATAVTQTVTLPAGATLTGPQLSDIQAAYPGTSYSGGSGGTLTFPQALTVAAGASNLFRFVFTAPATAGAASIGSTVGTSTTQSPNTAPDAASFALNVSSVADVAATIVGTGTAVSAGATGTFTATFTNNGPSAAAGTVPTVQLSPSVTNVTINGAGPTLTSGGIATYAGGITYNTATGLLTGASATLNTGTPLTIAIGYTQPMQGNVTATAAITTATSQGVLSADGNPATANDVKTATNTGAPGFDLATTLAGPAAAVAGTQVTYAVTTSNNGPGAAPNAVQTVSMVTTTALTNVFLTNGGTYLYSGGTSVFTFPTIPALGNGQQVNNSISFTSPASSASSLSLTSLITPNTSVDGDANTPNNQFSISTNLTTAPTAAGTTANLNVSISSDAPTGGVAAGTAVVFTVKQGNNGPNGTTNVVTRVYLSTGLSGVVVKDKNNATLTGAYNPATGVVTFSNENTQASGSAPLTYSITANAPASGVMTATATVAADTNDPVPADNVALTAVTVNVPTAGDVATTLNGPATATPGESIVYTVAAINNGTTAATDVTQTVRLPAGLPSADVVVREGTNIIANTATTGYNSATGLVSFTSTTSLAAGASLTRTITLLTPSNAGSATGGSLVPVASIGTKSTDNVLTNNSASLTTVIKPSTDFAVSLTGPATTVAGSAVTYAVTVTNNGASVGGQQTTVQLPGGLDAAGGGLVLPTGATYNGTTGVLTLAAVAAQGLGSASAVTNAVTFNLPAGLVLLTPTAQVAPASGTNDPALANNAATAATTVTPVTEAVIDLATDVAANIGTQTAGLPIIFTVTSTNNTNGTSATNAIQQLALAAGLTGVLVNNAGPTATANGVSTYAGGATYDATTGVVTFPAATLANGSPVSRTVQVNAPGAGPLVARASLKGDQTDAAPANNTFGTSVTITPSADLATSVTGPATTAPGTPVSYSVITTNAGPSAALGVVPAITLPSGATNVLLPPGASQVGSVVSFAATGNLASGQLVTNTLTFTAPTAAGAYNVLSNASTTTTESNSANNGNTTATTSTAPTAAPVAFDVVNSTTYNATAGTVNSPSANTAGQFLLSPLRAAAAAGQQLNTYTIVTPPTSTQGTLYYYNGTSYVAVGSNKDLTSTQAASLKFDPADNATTTNSVGDITFSYTVTDNAGKTSNTALYTIPVGRDNNSVYTATTSKGGTSQYQNNDVLAFVIDPNGAAYNGSGLVYNPAGTTANILATGGNSGLVNQPNSVVQATTGPAASGLYPANPTNVLPAGVSLNTTTGLIYVSNRALLVNYNSVKYYQINVTTTDVNGGTNLVTAQFSIGAYPLPVELTAFTATAVHNLDASLAWRTASEKSNDHFEVERSFTGTDYEKIGQVQGQGSKAGATDYTLTDAAVARKASGPVYYRLKQVDTDGTATYSPVRTVAFTTASMAPAIVLYPNPATAATTLDLGQLPAGRYTVQVLDATGRVVLRAQQEAGIRQVLELTSIASGAYTVRVSGPSLNLTKRLVKE